MSQLSYISQSTTSYHSEPFYSENVLERSNSSYNDDEQTIGPACVHVFLGGSCNPTQWRRDEAIPAFESAAITYYNPQRNDWYPELVDQERLAKIYAQILLFVHDRKTRALASMVEVAEMVSRKSRQLVIAVEDLDDKIMGEVLSSEEKFELTRARTYLKDIAKACDIGVHSSIRGAVQKCIEKRNEEVASDRSIFSQDKGFKSSSPKYNNVNSRGFRNGQKKNIFICGPKGRFDWKTLADHSLSKISNVKTRVNEGSEHFYQSEMEQIEENDILLFVFPEDTWGAAEMIMASYFIGREKKVVLCLPECRGVKVNGQPMSSVQVKDYNRSRRYLADCASEHGAEVFQDIEQALRRVAKLAS